MGHPVIIFCESDTEDHDLGGFDEGGYGFSFFEAHFAGGVGGDDGGDDLASDGEADLGEEAFEFEVDDAADELVASADGAHHLAFGRPPSRRRRPPARPARSAARRPAPVGPGHPEDQRDVGHQPVAHPEHGGPGPARVDVAVLVLVPVGAAASGWGSSTDRA